VAAAVDLVGVGLGGVGRTGWCRGDGAASEGTWAARGGASDSVGVRGGARIPSAQTRRRRAKKAQLAEGREEVPVRDG
jgi:hypothetical protein